LYQLPTLTCHAVIAGASFFWVIFVKEMFGKGGVSVAGVFSVMQHVLCRENTVFHMVATRTWTLEMAWGAIHGESSNDDSPT